MPPFAELNNRVAIVTGAAQGIGRNSAVTLAEHGMPVVLADLNDTRGQQVEEEIQAAGGRAAYVHATSEPWPAASKWSRPPSTASAASTPSSTTPAGTPTKSSWTSPEADWDRSQDVLIKSHFMACKLAHSPHDRRRRRLDRWNLVRPRHPGFNAIEGPYEAAKAAINALMRNVAVAYGANTASGPTASCPAAS